MNGQPNPAFDSDEYWMVIYGFAFLDVIAAVVVVSIVATFSYFKRVRQLGTG